MFCPKCGFQVADGAKFCPKCGYQIPETSQDVSHQSQPESSPTYQVKPQRKFPLIPVAIGGVLVVAIVAVVVLGVMGIGPVAGFFSGGTGAVSEEPGHTQGNYTANISVGYGYGVSDGEYDYFLSYQAGGVCRAKWNDDNPQAELIYPLEMDQNSYSYATSLNIDDGWLYLCEFSYDYSGDGDETQQIVRMRTDGSEPETVYEFDMDDDEDVTYSISSLYIFDGKLYVLGSKYLRDTTKNVYQVIRMNEDGSDVEELGEVQVDGYAYFVLTPTRMYYAVGRNNSSSTSQTMSTIYAQDLDGSNLSVVYESKVGAISALTYKDGRLYFTESNSNVNYQQFVSVAEDGSDVKQLYESKPGKNAYVGMYSDDSMYLIVYENENGYAEFPSYLEAVPLSGEGETTRIDLPDPDGAFNISLLYAGDHMIVLNGGGDVGSLGFEVWGMSLDGSEQKTYTSGD